MPHPPPGDGNAPDTPPLDRALLAELRDALGDPLLVSLATDYLTAARRLLATMGDRDQPPGERAHAAHGLAGSSLSLGLARIAGRCQAVEVALAGGRTAEADHLLGGLAEQITADQAQLVAVVSATS